LHLLIPGLPTLLFLMLLCSCTAPQGPDATIASEAARDRCPRPFKRVVFLGESTVVIAHEIFRTLATHCSGLSRAVNESNEDTPWTQSIRATHFGTAPAAR